MVVIRDVATKTKISNSKGNKLHAIVYLLAILALFYIASYYGLFEWAAGIPKSGLLGTLK